jgi:DNA processing protein
MEIKQELIFQIAITLIPKIGSVNARKLIAYTGSPEAVFREKSARLEKIPGIGKHIASLILKADVLGRAEDEIRFIEANQIEWAYFMDDHFPTRLKECEDGPLLVFYKGTCNFNQRKIISLIGTRKPSSYGKQFVKDFLYGLRDSNHQVLVVSGLAFGIDILAHRYALECGFETIGVLAHGLDRIYPYEHREVARMMIDRGALLTEFLSYTNPDPQNFVKRNRIIAGLSDATIVIESASKGGSLITAELANSYNREVFAVPGRVRDDMSLGCNALISCNKASILRDACDLERALSWQHHKKRKSTESLTFKPELSEDEKLLLNYLKETNDQPIDQLNESLNYPASKLNSMLLQLEFAGILEVLPGKIIRLL